MKVAEYAALRSDFYFVILKIRKTIMHQQLYIEFTECYTRNPQAYKRWSW